MASHNGISHFEFTSQIFDVRCLLDAMFLTCASGKGPRQIPDTLERFRLSALVGTHWCYSRVGGVLLPGLPHLSGFILTLAISLVINSLTNPRFNLRSDERGLSAECLTKEAETIISEKYEEIKDTVQVCECVSVCVCVSV